MIFCNLKVIQQMMYFYQVEHSNHSYFHNKYSTLYYIMDKLDETTFIGNEVPEGEKKMIKRKKFDLDSLILVSFEEKYTKKALPWQDVLNIVSCLFMSKQY